MPATSTLRVDNSIKNSTMNRCSPRRGPHFHGEEIHGHNQFPMPAQKLLPGRLPTPLRRWLDSVTFQNLSDRAACKLVPQIRQRALDAPIAPIPVLLCHSNHQSLDLSGGTRPARSALATAVVFLGDQLSMPGQQGLGRDNGSELRQKFPAQSFAIWTLPLKRGC
jgi:hypothetical protein